MLEFTNQKSSSIDATKILYSLLAFYDSICKQTSLRFYNVR